MTNSSLLNKEIYGYFVDRIHSQNDTTTLYYGFHITNSNPVAIKVSSQENFENLEKTKNFKHDNLVNIYEIEKEGDNIVVIRDWLEHKNLLEMLTLNSISLIDIISIVKYCLLGVSYLHKQNVFHGNVNLQNVFVYNSNHILLTDFGLIPVSDANTDIHAIGNIFYKLITNNAEDENTTFFETRLKELVKDNNELLGLIQGYYQKLQNNLFENAREALITLQPLIGSVYQEDNSSEPQLETGKLLNTKMLKLSEGRKKRKQGYGLKRELDTEEVSKSGFGLKRDSDIAETNKINRPPTDNFDKLFSSNKNHEISFDKVDFPKLKLSPTEEESSDNYLKKDEDVDVDVELKSSTNIGDLQNNYSPVSHPEPISSSENLSQLELPLSEKMETLQEDDFTNSKLFSVVDLPEDELELEQEINDFPELKLSPASNEVDHLILEEPSLNEMSEIKDPDDDVYTSLKAPKPIEHSQEDVVFSDSPPILQSSPHLQSSPPSDKGLKLDKGQIQEVLRSHMSSLLKDVEGTGTYVIPKPIKKQYQRKKMIYFWASSLSILVMMFIYIKIYTDFSVNSAIKDIVEYAFAKNSVDINVVIENKGWFNEEMPKGLKKGSKKGEYIWEKDSSLMVYVPSGTFWRGSDNGKNNEKPEKLIYLSSFYIDKYELNNEKYRKFLSATKHAIPLYWKNENINKNIQPIVGINWDDAQSYANWSGKRLPYEAEWEKASRGGIKIPKLQGNETESIELIDNPFPRRIFPWGEKKNKKFVYQGIGTKKKAYSRNVSSFFAGRSPYGCHHMLGNVWEWCADTYDKNSYLSAQSQNPQGPSKKVGNKICRGGSWQSSFDIFVYSRRSLNPKEKKIFLGARFVVSGKDNE